MLQINNVVKHYGNQIAVNDVSFNIPGGEIFGLLGPNGAGKSSLLRMITGITKPDSGAIHLNGKEVKLEEVSSLIGYMPEERGLYKKMKVADHLIYLARLKGLSLQTAKEQTNYWLQKLQMQTWANKKVQDLSKGMSQKMQFVTTVIHQPQLLILDEPFSGLDPVNAELIKQEIFELSKKGITIIFSTHRMEQLEEICNSIVLMNKGCKILEGEISAIKRSFSESLFELNLSQPINFEDANFEITSTGTNSYLVKIKNEKMPNDLIAYCMSKQVQVVSFKEKLPSLNDIFIKLVENNAVTKFN